MPYGSGPVDPVAGTVITVAWCIANVLDPIRTLRANTGGADPPAANRIAISTGVGGPTTWQQAPADAILAGAITDVKMALQKVNKSNPDVLTFGAGALAHLSGFLRVGDASGPITDAPSVFQDWHLLQIRHPNTGVDYRWQLAINITDQNEIYQRLIINAVPGAWKKVWHAGNLGSAEIVMANTIGLTLGGPTTPGRLYDAAGVLTVLRGHASRVGIYNSTLATLMLDIQATLLVAAGAIQAASAAIAGAISAASLTLSGALSAASATITGALSANTVTATGAVTAGSQLVANTPASPPLVVASSTLVANLNASYLNGFTDAAFAGAGHTHAPIANAAKVVIVPYTGNGAASRSINVGIAPAFVVIQKLTAQGMVFGVGHDGVILETVTPGGVLVGWGFGATTITVTGGYNTSAINYRAVVIGT